jgi:hypothetical protein
MNLLRVEAFPERRLDGASELNYDAALFSLGYEPRCRAIPANVGHVDQRVVASFTDRVREPSFEDNRAWYQQNGHKIVEVDGHAYREWVHSWLAEVTSHDASGREAMRVLIDISSMTRLRIAAVVEALNELQSPVAVRVDFLYAPELYHEPPPPADATLSIGPVSPYFAGWSTELDRPLIAVIGLGFEPDKAAGAVEFLEPEHALACSPLGPDPRFREKLEESNSPLWSERVTRGFDYPLSDPYRGFVRLESRVQSLLRSARPLLVPLGPKIFALACLLVAALHEPAVPVWRVSSGELEEPVPREASGQLYGLTVWRDAVNPQSAYSNR